MEIFDPFEARETSTSGIYVDTRWTDLMSHINSVTPRVKSNHFAIPKLHLPNG